MSKTTKIIVISAFLASCSIGFANELLVPSQYPTIQSAIDAAIDGDTVIVAPGTYTGPGNYNISFEGKSLTVRSDGGQQSCVIDCEGLGRGFYVLSYSNGSVLEGFTIMNGYVNQPGEWAHGAGIYCSFGNPTIKNCTIKNCQVTGQWAFGGGISCEVDSQALIANCTITGNTAKGQWAYGGGIYTAGSVTIVNCLVSNNSASSDYMASWGHGGGIYCDYFSTIITNCIFWNNAAPTEAEIYVYGRADVTYSDVRGGYAGEGNINAYPLLTPDGHLQAGSPCIDSGDPDFLPEPGQVDIDGQPRIMGGRVDMGIDEVTAPLLSAMVLSAKKFEFDANEDGPNPQPQILSIRNVLDNTLNWEITENCPWLEVYPHSGTSTYEPNNVTLSVNTTGLIGGVYSCILTISSPNAVNSPRMVTVNLVVQGPIIAVSAKEVEFEYVLGEPDPPSQTFGIGNIGGGTLNWVISSNDCNWLNVDPISGSSIGEADEVNLSVDVAALPLGVYNCTLSVIDPNVDNSPQTITVTLNVYKKLLHVPGDIPTIQAAIDVAEDGTTIIVAPGTYTGPGNWDLDFLGKAITVRSVAPTDPLVVAGTIINCNEPSGYPPHSGFSFHNNEDANSILAGFTFTNCHGVGAIQCSSRPTIKNCIITGNAGNDGGGITCYGNSSRPTITNCTISNNIGSGIYCDYYSSPAITNCTITGNSGSGRPPDTRGGGIFCYDNSSPVITSCTITGNSAGSDGGGICSYSTSIPKVASCTISGNSAKGHGGGIFLASTSSPIFVTNSIIWGNVDSTGTGQSAQVYSGKPDVWFSCIQDDNPNDVNVPFGADKYNIDDDPCFVDGNYHLLPASPCIEAGNPFFTYHLGDVDMDGQPRLMGRRIDIGADEFEISVIVVTKPKGGEVWTGGSTHEIKWDSYGISGTVDIYYSTNNGADWVKIDNVPDTGSFTWHLPASQNPWFCHKPPVDSNQCLISVKPHIPVTNLICIESGPFTIQPYRNLPAVPWWPGYPHRKFGPKYGCVKWKFQTGGPVTAGVAIGYNNRVHVPCEDGKLYTLSAGGKLLWTYDTNSPLVCSPAVDRSGNVYVGAENGKLYAIDRNGRLLWTHTTDGPIYSSPVVLFDDPLCGYPCPYWKTHSPPWEQPDQIFVGSVDGTLYALGHDGSELWSFETDSLSAVTTGAIFASPAIDHSGSLHIAGIYDPNLYALDSNNADIKWNRNFSSQVNPSGRRPWPFASSVIAEDGTIYQTLLYDPNLYAIDPNNGSIIWSTNLADPCSGWFEPDYAEIYGPASCWSKPALAPDGTIYVNLNDPYLRAVDHNGNIKWVTRLGMLGGFTLAVGGNGLIYAACDDAYLYVVDPDGGQVAQFEGFGGLSFPTITLGRTIIVSDANNTVWAIGRHNCWGRALDLHRLEDLNGDRAVNNTDFAILTADWLNCTDTDPPCDYQGDEIYLKGDINKDQYVNFADLAQLANRWLNKE